MFRDMRVVTAMNDPEKLYLSYEMLHFVLTFELRSKKNKNQIYSIRLPKIRSQIVDVLAVATLTVEVEESPLVAQLTSLTAQYLILRFME